MLMMLEEIVIVVAASAAIVAGIGGLIYMLVLSALEERDDYRHTQANALARRARTSRQLTQPDAKPARQTLAGRAQA